MKFFIVSLFTIVGIVAALAYPAEDKYTTKYDGVDLKQILQSDRLTENYVMCLLDEKPCPADGAELKSVLGEALQTDCAKCSDKQKEGTRTVLKHLYKNKEDWFKQLAAKYDPEGIYAKKHEADLKSL